MGETQKSVQDKRFYQSIKLLKNSRLLILCTINKLCKQVNIVITFSLYKVKNIIDSATRQDWIKICDSRLAITLLRHSISVSEHARSRVSDVRHSVRIEQRTIFSIASRS